MRRRRHTLCVAFLVTFGAMPKVTGPARPWSALVAKIKLHFVRPFDGLRANGCMRSWFDRLTTNGDAVLFIPPPPHPNPLPRGERGQGREERGDRTA